MSEDWGADRGLFAISVASELTGVNPQMLRVYESKGLVEPQRTEGGTRRYTNRDIDRIKKITLLLESGLNLAGVSQVLALEAETDRLRQQLDELRLDRRSPNRKDARGETPG